MNVKDKLKIVKVEEDKITISPIEFDSSNLELLGYDKSYIDFQKKIYNSLCNNLGLDPSKGEIVLEKTKNDEKKLLDYNDVVVNKDTNTAIISSEEFNMYKNFKQDLDMKMRKEEIEEHNPDKETLEMIINMQAVIWKFIMKYVD